MKLKEKDKVRSHYFQTIAAVFFARRGAPFFLSAKDLDLISTWENLGIPLTVVSEGIEKAFENFRGKPSTRARAFSLSFCQSQVLKAFGQDRERKVGGKKGGKTREEKRKKAKAEIQRFLDILPPEISYLKEIYLLAKKKISESRLEEDDFEQLDDKAEALLLENCPEGMKDKERGKIIEENRSLGREELEKVLKVKLVKLLRDKYRVPYFSLYYY